MGQSFPMREETKCSECGGVYTSVEQHWSQTSGHREDILQYEDSITGMTMGDGSITYCGSKNPRLHANMTNSKFILYLWKKFGIHSTRTIGYKTPDEAEMGAQSLPGLSDSPNFSGVFTFTTYSHPDLSIFDEWSTPGGKVFPEDTRLSPEILKHWYCGDGNVHLQPGSDHIVITSVNEVGNEEKIEGMFSDIGFDVSFNEEFIRVPVSQSPEFLEYMGSPPPGFEHKWILDDREAYERQREQDYERPPELKR